MKKSMIVVFFLLFAGLGLHYVKARLDSELGGPELGETPVIEGAPSHRATPEMIAAAKAMASREAPSFRAVASDGETYSLTDLAREGPLALLFIKDGCPCSREAEPFFDRLYEAYGKRVRFFGVIDGDVAVARRWAAENRVPFPILSDPDLKVVREYKAENSAYAALVARGGTIDQYWPGYSAGMLKEAGERLARLAGVGIKTIDVADAPDQLYSGCPY